MVKILVDDSDLSTMSISDMADHITTLVVDAINALQDNENEDSTKISVVSAKLTTIYDYATNIVERAPH